MQVGAAEGGLRLSDGGLQCGQVTNPWGATGSSEDEAVKFNHLPQREIPGHARRRYSSSFFRITRSAAA
jgi:hypothetical protein